MFDHVAIMSWALGRCRSLINVIEPAWQIVWKWNYPHPVVQDFWYNRYVDIRLYISQPAGIFVIYVMEISELYQPLYGRFPAQEHWTVQFVRTCQRVQDTFRTPSVLTFPPELVVGNDARNDLTYLNMTLFDDVAMDCNRDFLFANCRCWDYWP